MRCDWQQKDKTFGKVQRRHEMLRVADQFTYKSSALVSAEEISRHGIRSAVANAFIGHGTCLRLLIRRTHKAYHDPPAWRARSACV